MSNKGEITESDFYIEFSYKDNNTFRRINNLINYVRREKKAERLNGDDINVMDFYTNEELEYFWWPTDAENKEFWEKYYSIPKEQWECDIGLKINWDLESVLDAISNGEYEILGCRIIKANVARIYFDPWAYPYGGNSALVELIKPFTIKIIKIEG